MTTKGEPGSKIPTTQTNTNKKKSEAEGRPFDSAFFKKNEFALILLGALLLTTIVFLVFFRSSGPDPEQMMTEKKEVASSFDALEKRIKALETGLSTPKPDAPGGTAGSAEALADLTDRVTKLETAFLVKFESMVDRLGKLEKDYTALSQKAAALVVQQPPKPAAATVMPKATAKTAKKEKNTNIFHTVEKGETLYSISKKYNTTVAALKKLNNLSDKDKIYPGNNIIVR